MTTASRRVGNRLRRLRATFLRPWLIVIVGLTLSTVAAAYETRKPGIYWGQVNVTFVAPLSNAFPNSIVTGSESLTITAGAVAKIVGSSVSGAHVASDQVTLYGQGVRHGYSVTLPNSGGQYVSNFTQSLLNVQAVDPDPAKVLPVINRVVDEIQSTLLRMQQAKNASPADFITTHLSPPQPQLYYISGSKSRAGVMTFVLGLGITWTIALVVSRARWRRKGPPPTSVADPTRTDRELATV